MQRGIAKQTCVRLPHLCIWREGIRARADELVAAPRTISS